MRTLVFRSQVRRVRQTHGLLLTLLAESLCKGLAVWIKQLLATLLPGRFEFGRRDVPVQTAFPRDDAQILTEILDRRPPKEPVTVVDLVNDKAGLQHDDVRDHRVVDRIGVLGNIKVLLNDPPRI